MSIAFTYQLFMQAQNERCAQGARFLDVMGGAKREREGCVRGNVDFFTEHFVFVARKELCYVYMNDYCTYIIVLSECRYIFINYQ